VNYHDDLRVSPTKRVTTRRLGEARKKGTLRIRAPKEKSGTLGGQVSRREILPEVKEVRGGVNGVGGGWWVLEG